MSRTHQIPRPPQGGVLLDRSAGRRSFKVTLEGKTDGQFFEVGIQVTGVSILEMREMMRQVLERPPQSTQVPAQE